MKVGSVRVGVEQAVACESGSVLATHTHTHMETC
jgi:hypothetical protein